MLINLTNKVLLNQRLLDRLLWLEVMRWSIPGGKHIFWLDFAYVLCLVFSRLRVFTHDVFQVDLQPFLVMLAGPLHLSASLPLFGERSFQTRCLFEMIDCRRGDA
jgi:hypothetical protein